MRLLLILAVAVSRAEQSPAERLIEAGHWKRARTLVETRLRQASADALSNFLLSQIRGAFGDRSTPWSARDAPSRSSLLKPAPPKPRSCHLLSR
jgi:hypothetical protein